MVSGERPGDVAEASGNEPGDDVAAGRRAPSAAIEHLRDRTDELELIISSLTIFALLSMPGWLFDRFADSYTHHSTSIAVAGLSVVTLLAGVCYGLAACFVVHLMARAYWVGLIGLRAVFPGGINWDRIPGLGPLGREHYRRSLPDIDTIIRNTDRLASSLFAVISMLTLGVLWFGVLFVVVLVVASAIGARFGLTNTGIGIGTLVYVGLALGVPLLIYLVDGQLVRRFPQLQERRAVRSVVRGLRRVSEVMYPQRLVMPVQLTLQSNTRPVVFLLSLVLSGAVMVVIGNTRAAGWMNFTLSNEFTYLDDDGVIAGFRSSHYEDMASELDRLRAWPRIDRFEQGGSHVRLFLPYQPLRDNLVLEALCGPADALTEPALCLRELWSVSIEGRTVPMSVFMPAERADLSMRGLIGLVPLAGIQPGLRSIEVTWNPRPSDDAVRLDDRYQNATIRYTIPIAFAPGYELPLP